MRNVLLPPVSSQFNSIGNNEVQIPNVDVMQMENKGNGYEDAFSLEPKVFYSNSQQRDGAFALPYMSRFDYQQDYQAGNSNCGDISQQSSLLDSNPAFIPFELEIKNIHNASKPPVEVNDILPLNGISDAVECNTSLNYQRKNKRRKVYAFEPQQPYQVVGSLTEIREGRLQVPVRRSQKLSDKITTLQKLVSPYGKTDTASVLQEASLYIKLLHGQIQNLYKMLSSSYNGTAAVHTEETGCKELNLRSRGLCLVPPTLIQNVTKEDQINYDIL